MSVFAGGPAYPNSKIDFQDATRVIKREDGALLVRAPYGGPRIVMQPTTPAPKA